MQNKQKIKYNSGAAMIILVLFFVFISVTILIGIITPVVREFKIATDGFKSKQSYFLAESGLEDILYRMKNNINYDNNEVLVLGEKSITTTVSDISSNQKEIISLGDVNSLQRKINLKVNTGKGVSFSYGVMTGKGGFTMNNNSEITGNLYSNGTIIGSGKITGSAVSANSSSLYSDQSNGIGVPTYDVSFGHIDSKQDFAQSFQISITDTINKVSIYLKKVGLPSNLTVRIVNDSLGSPGNTTIASGSLSASLVSTNYGWVDVPFSTNPVLTAGTTYWLVIDGSTSSSKYYKIGTNLEGYNNGIGKIGRQGVSWSNTTPSGLDAYFNLYLGGVFGLIDGITIGDNSYAHTVRNSTITGINYCQIGSENNKACNTSKPDPVSLPMPISDQNILDWKEAAEVGGIYSGNYLINETIGTLGPKKITGNLTIQNNATLNITGILWVQGDMLVDNKATVKLTSGYGSSDGVIVVDGTVSIQNNATFEDSGTTGSYILVLSTSDSVSAISLENNGGAVILYAANGTLTLGNNARAKALNGHKINLGNNVVVTYENGLMNSNFISGPSGSWNIFDWQEVE